MSLVSSLRSSRQLTRAWAAPNHKIVYKSAVATLVRQIEVEAARCGLSLSRWQTMRRGSSQPATVAWAVHRGPRAANSTVQSEAIAIVRFAGREGASVSSVAYRRLSRLLAAVRAMA